VNVSGKLLARPHSARERNIDLSLARSRLLNQPDDVSVGVSYTCGQSSAHRFLHERADLCLLGGGQLLQREGDWLLAGMSARKQTLTLYMLGGWEHNAELLAKLGKHSLGKGCLYIKRLDDVNMPVLKRLIAESLKRAKKLAQAEAQKQTQQTKR